jgi:CO/xanthine dehydrogenase Mo-binding subunit
MEAPCFVTDIYLPQMLYALTVRSPIAKGRLISIDCPKLPGSYTLLSAKDIPGKNCIEDSALPVLAGDEISYLGEPVALLLGPDKNTLEDYSRHCKVIVTEATPVFSPAEADQSMIAGRREIRVGDTETAFAQAASIVRGSYSSGIQEHWYAEPSGTVAWLDEEDLSHKGGVLIVRTATQWPFHVKRSVSQLLGLPVSRVLVEPTVTGLHMDGKLWYPSLVSCHAALGAWITKRPVRLILTRAEDFCFSPKRCGTEIIMSSALNEKGEITGIEINTTVNLGAYGVNTDEILDQVNLGTLGIYKTNNIRLTSTAVRTNIPPQGPFAGFGLAQGFLAIESHVSHIADQLKRDPAQWRSENCILGETLPNGLPLKETAPVQELIDAVIKMSDYGRKWLFYERLRQHRGRQFAQAPAAGVRIEKKESLRGIGIAVGYQGNGFLYPGADKGRYSIELVLEKNGVLEIKTSLANCGNDYESIWAGLASGILGMDKKKVRINSVTNVPDSGPITMSRKIAVLSRLVEQGCREISRKRNNSPLPLSIRKTTRPQNAPLWDECFSPKSPDYNGFARLGWASAIVEIEIDPIDFLPWIRGVWMAVDGGKIIAEDRARKSLKESSIQALGWAYREQISYVNGIIPADQYDNFNIPSPVEIPPINIGFINGGQNEPKGIGDLPFTCIPAAYLQAVSQAMDYKFQSIPLKALDIWYAGVAKRKKGEPA